MTDNDLPNFAEADVTDIWKYRQEFEEEEQHGQVRKRHAQTEILRRADEAGATVLQTDAGPVKITYSNEYSYSAAVVDREFFALIKRDGLEDEWNQFVSHSYKIRRTWLNELAARGDEYREVIEKMTVANKGSPNYKGPSLQELGGYAPREEETATI